MPLDFVVSVGEGDSRSDNQGPFIRTLSDQAFYQDVVTVVADRDFAQVGFDHFGKGQAQFRGGADGAIGGGHLALQTGVSKHG
ncbi:hypothetical protein D3C80_1845480 [compost metagenome]